MWVFKVAQKSCEGYQGHVSDIWISYEMYSCACLNKHSYHLSFEFLHFVMTLFPPLFGVVLDQNL